MGAVFGVSCVQWTILFTDSHSITSGGVILNDWPDGQCLLEQEVGTVHVFGLINDELKKMMGGSK